MSAAIARYIVAGLGAAASVSALPHEGAYNGTASTSTLVTLTSASSGTQIAAPTVTIPAAVAAPDAAAASAAAAANAALGKAAAADVSNVARFNTLLTVDGRGQQLLPPDQLRQRVVFDFNRAAAAPNSLGGRVIAANVGNFPILVDQGLSTTVGFLEPCSMNSPHTHPRAAEWYTVVQGSVRTGFMLENGFLANAAERRLTTEVAADLNTFQGTIFPMGSIHFQFNDNCEPAAFVATLNSEDPGTSQIVQNFFFQDDQVVNVTLGEIQNINGQNLEQFRTSLPINLVQAVDSCLARCNN